MPASGSSRQCRESLLDVAREFKHLGQVFAGSIRAQTAVFQLSFTAATANRTVRAKRKQCAGVDGTTVTVDVLFGYIEFELFAVIGSRLTSLVVVIRLCGQACGAATAVEAAIRSR